MKRLLVLLFLAAVSCRPGDGEYVFKVITTNDIHGHYFDSLYVGRGVRNSMASVSWYVDSVRTAAGRENVILIDAGDFLQGDNAAYYFNFVDTLSEHVFSRIAEYMGYDAVVAGNHDIETGHPVYDRLKVDMDVPMLAANALRNDGRGSYFGEYTVLRRNGLKIAVIGFTNPNIPGWLSEELWKGMHFEDLVPYAQNVVDRVCSRENPDVVIVAAHTGTGNGDMSQRENAGLDLFRSLRGVDLVVCAHDHRPVAHGADSIALVNSGSRCSSLGLAGITVRVKDGKVVSKSSDAEILKISSDRRDTVMTGLFREDFLKVRAFTCQEIGELKCCLRTVDAYKGMSAYLDLIHSVCLLSTGAHVSFAAPLTFDGTVAAGTLLYNDLFTIYPYENQLYVVGMTGKEIKDYLEYSYDSWIYTYGNGSEHLLKIVDVPDPRTGTERWSFVARPYNFDSAGGLVYEVDVTKEAGNRVIVRSFADGTPFDESQMYNVAMTSYRANGGGGIIRHGAGLDAAAVNGRIVSRHPEIRDLIYEYLKKNKVIDPEVTGDPSVVGAWKFTPVHLAERAMEKDMSLLF